MGGLWTASSAGLWCQVWIAIAATIAAFARIPAPAAWLLAPYLVWVSFASVLNFRIWTLNR